MSDHGTFFGFLECALGYQAHSDDWPYARMASMIYWTGCVKLGLVIC